MNTESTHRTVGNRICAAIFLLFLAATAANVHARQAEPHIASGVLHAIGACDLKAIEFFLEKGLHPDDVIEQSRGRAMQTAYTKAVTRVWTFTRAISAGEAKALRAQYRRQYLKDDFGNYRDREWWSSTRQCLDVVQRLLDAGASVEGTDGVRAWFQAINTNIPEFVQMLEAHGADIFQTDRRGNNALMLLAPSVPLHYDDKKMKCNGTQDYCGGLVMATEVMELVLGWYRERRPELINATNQKGETPLLIAMRHYNPPHEGHFIQRAEYWLEAGADPCLEDARGMNASEIAMARNGLETSKLLECNTP